MEAINADVRAQLKRRFEQLFPEQAKRLQAISDNMRQATATEKADYEAELDRIRADLFDIIGRKYGKALGKNDDDGLAIQLRPEKYGEFVNARGSDIETKMLLLLDSLSRLQDVDKSNTDAVVATIIYGGLSAVTASAIAYITKLVTDSAMELLPAAFATVEFCTTSTIVTAVCVVVVMLIIPLIYFVEKPAVCIALVINELRQGSGVYRRLLCARETRYDHQQDTQDHKAGVGRYALLCGAVCVPKEGQRAHRHAIWLHAQATGH